MLKPPPQTTDIRELHAWFLATATHYARIADGLKDALIELGVSETSADADHLGVPPSSESAPRLPPPPPPPRRQDSPPTFGGADMASEGKAPRTNTGGLSYAMRAAEYLRIAGRPLAVKDIAEGLGIPRASLNSSLGRAVEAGTLTKAGHGLYTVDDGVPREAAAPNMGGGT